MIYKTRMKFGNYKILSFDSERGKAKAWLLGNSC